MKKINFEDDTSSAELWQPFQQLFSTSLPEIAHLEVFQPAEKIIQIDQGTETLYILLKGKAKIYMIHEDGKQSIIQFIQRGELIGELSLLGVEEHTKDVVAQEMCTCLAIPLTKQRENLLNDLHFSQQLNVYLAKKLLSRTERFSEGLNYPLLNRLAAFILYTENDGEYREKHTEVAEYLSVSYRHLIHTFQQLVEMELIVKDKPTYHIIKRTKLEALGNKIRV